MFLDILFSVYRFFLLVLLFTVRCALLLDNETTILRLPTLQACCFPLTYSCIASPHIRHCALVFAMGSFLA